jgi:2-polyprenyl-3-methyl-5-hydroxy-6-metoxy-1,4-benzoquinol methylase
MRSLAHPTQQDEQMDAADLDPAVYAQVLTDLAAVNRWTFTARPTIAFVKRAIGERTSFSLLDVGFGDGDLLRAIAGWAGKAGKHARLTGVDLNPKSAGIARAKTPARFAIEYLAGDYLDHVGAKEKVGGFDLIVSSQVAHHMTHQQLQTFLRTMEARARQGWQISDLHRHRFSYLGFPLLCRMMGWHRIVREDGQLSIARSFRPAEWRPILAEAGIGPEAEVHRRFPFRLCVERLR